MQGDGWRGGGSRGGILININSLFVSSDPMVAYPEVIVQVRDLVRVVGIVAPFAPRGSVFGELRCIEPRGQMGTGDLCRVLPAAVRHGRARLSSGAGAWGSVDGSCGDRARRVSILGKFVLSRNPGYKNRGIAMWLNVVLNPG